MQHHHLQVIQQFNNLQVDERTKNVRRGINPNISIESVIAQGLDDLVGFGTDSGEDDEGKDENENLWTAAQFCGGSKHEDNVKNEDESDEGDSSDDKEDSAMAYAPTHLPGPQATRAPSALPGTVMPAFTFDQEGRSVFCA